MDSVLKVKDSNCNAAPAVSASSAGTFNHSHTTISAIVHLCNSDSFSIIPPPHQDLVSANSIELNAAASLSDDSGVPLTTNSSISSGDSYRMGMCKLEIEMVESDGEVSQFDSLDNCSEGGMSAENFNTLKKGPLAPIDPPPEFQDSPRTTLVRSISKNIVGSLRRWTSSQSSFEHLKDHSSSTKTVETSNDLVVNGIMSGGSGTNNVCNEANDGQSFPYHNDRNMKDAYAINKHLYSSDSILNSHTDNIYDEPNNIISTSLGNSVDIIESDSSSPLPSPPPPVSMVKIKQTLCPYYQDHTRYFKAIPSEQDNITTAVQRFNLSGLSEIHDYDLYHGVKRNTYQLYESSVQRKVLYSPLSHSHHCNSHHYHSGINMCGNRPNSRNSLNSRLSSSHNSLSVASANKPDDSIFITQAMSHDALLTREISDFYNVPIDSDIYAFPVDMIQSEKQKKNKNSSSQYYFKEVKTQLQSIEVQPADELPNCHHYKPNRRNNRNKRKKNEDVETKSSEKFKNQNSSNKVRYRLPVSSTVASNDTSLGNSSQSEANTSQLFSYTTTTTTKEPPHMTLDEVKQFYHTLYSDAKTASTTLNRVQGSKMNSTKASNETIWSMSSTRSHRGNNIVTIKEKEKNTSNVVAKTNTKKLQKLNVDNDNNVANNNNNSNNNNNVNVINNQISQSNHCQSQLQEGGGVGGVGVHTNATIDNCTLLPFQTANTTANNINNKQTVHSEKKSQFTLNLKQKFCSIFRFRRGHNRFRTSSSETEENIVNREQSFKLSLTADDKRKKFQFRALPPLPKKIEINTEENCEEKAVKKPESRSFHFTSSIEKVKDYGWYWGPLSSEAAEKVLSNEPDGSFIVRDSSDDHYIFSLSFKLNNCVRHVRIEQDQGTFSFGSYAKFKSQTITEFIEKAVEHSRSGRYLFFLHRRPEHGPMRVQLTNPVSRFKHVQSLQHMCRFVILKAVIRNDLIQTLPLPRRLLDYLNYKHCYSEQVESDSSQSQISEEGTL